MRLGEHSDYGTITLVFQLDSEGLQVRLSFNAACLFAVVGVTREIYAEIKLKLWVQWKQLILLKKCFMCSIRSYRAKSKILTSSKCPLWSDYFLT